MDTPQFPLELLQASPEARKAYFSSKVIAHPSIVHAHTLLMSALRHPTDGQIVMVIGAPGVGKTTVRKAMVRDLTTQFLAQPERHPGHLPVAGIELEAFGGGSFKWKQTRQALLHALHEPMVDKKVWYSTTMEGEHAVLQRSTRLSSDDLGELLLTVLAQRQPQALWFDEGQHLIKVAGARGLLDQLDVLKSLANRSCIPTVLFGTYEMNVLLGLSPQLDRRIFRIHIPRYHATQPADVAAFQQVLFGLQKHLPFPEEPHLVEDWEYFFTGSLGCVGILKDWLYQAAGAAFDGNERTLTRSMCETWARETDVLVDMFQRITSGETQFVQEHSTTELRTLLGLAVTDKATSSSTRIQPATRKTRPGTRNPVRDKVVGHG
ncbi:MAG: ATP-binding protein [Anaerolineae bacterium]|nr:ATP-binding protein [Anaerolineae bacterium]